MHDYGLGYGDQPSDIIMIQAYICMHVATGDCRIFAPIKKQNPKSVKGLILAYLVVYNNIVASNTIVSQWSLV